MPTFWERPTLRYLALLVVATVLGLVIWQGAEQGGQGPQSSGTREPESFANNAVYRSYDAQGQLSSILRSPRVEQFSDSDVAHMSTPRGTVFSKQSHQPWLLQAEQGTYNSQTDKLHLEGHVLITRPSPGQMPTQMHTPRLTLDNAQRIVHTDAPVTINGPQGTTHAVGMKAWINQRVLELLSQVNGTYQPDLIKSKGK